MVIEIFKKCPGCLIGIIDIAEEIIGILEDRSEEISQVEAQREKWVRQTNQNKNDLELPRAL